MLTISKPLSASQVRTYHEREFSSERQNDWSRDQQGHSEWQGKLAGPWGLEGTVGNEHFARLAWNPTDPLRSESQKSVLLSAAKNPE